MTWPPVSRIILGGMLKGLMLTTPESLTLGSLVVSSVHWICLWMVSLASPVVPRAVPGKCPLRHTGRTLEVSPCGLAGCLLRAGRDALRRGYLRPVLLVDLDDYEVDGQCLLRHFV